MTIRRTHHTHTTPTELVMTGEKFKVRADNFTHHPRDIAYVSTTISHLINGQYAHVFGRQSCHIKSQIHEHVLNGTDKRQRNARSLKTVVAPPTVDARIKLYTR